MVHQAYKIGKEETTKKCHKCDIDFEDPSLFNDHLKSCIDELKDFKCKLCDTQWVSHLSLEHHLAVVHKMIRFVCEMCGKELKSPSNLECHRKYVHKKNFENVCHICAKSYRDKLLLDEHMIIAHGQGERKFKCDQCDKSFTRQFFLKTHQETHAKATLFKCDQCPKTFWMKSYLRTHVRMIHEKHRPHKCDTCPEAFVYKRDLIKHAKSHIKIQE